MGVASKLLKSFFTLVFALLLGGDVAAQTKDSVSIMAAANKFLDAFNHFKWEPFRQSFSDHATLLFPFTNDPQRKSGRAQYEAAWLQHMPRFLNNPDSRHLNIAPKDVQLQQYGNTAVMTFHLQSDSARIGRRTIVWVKQKGIWKIAHLHASSIELAPSIK